MIISLREIPEEGKQFQITRESGELNEALADLIGNTSYQAEFFLKPLLNSTYELTGSIRTHLDEQCSRCGEDFVFPVNEKFRELMIPELSIPRDGKYSHTNHLSDLHHEEVSVVEYQGEYFNVGEYLHEIVGLSRPFNPAPPPDDKDNCTVCKISLKDHSFSYDQDPREKEKPFAVLKNLKLN